MIEPRESYRTRIPRTTFDRFDWSHAKLISEPEKSRVASKGCLMGDDMTQKAATGRYSIYSFVTTPSRFMEVGGGVAGLGDGSFVKIENDAYPETIKPRGRARLVRTLSWPLVSTDAPATNDLNIILNNALHSTAPHRTAGVFNGP